MPKLLIDGEKLKLEDVVRVAGDVDYTVSISSEAKKLMQKSRDMVKKFLVEGAVVYGITTGFGKFANRRIATEDIETLQYNLIRSHSVGAGEPLPAEVVRAMLLLRANALAKGYSGIRPSTVETLLSMLNKNCLPVIPSKGSVGASGDLIPLAHMVLAMIGQGVVNYNGKRYEGKKGLELAGIKPATLTAKEGLALINGTQMMSAYGSLILGRADNILRTADIIAAMTTDALNGTTAAFDEKLSRVRPHPGQILVAKNMRRLMKGSRIRHSHIKCERVQDAYSLRCIPQVHGASRDAYRYVRDVLSIELNSATDNPLLFSETGEVLTGGNFHGQPLALALDFIGIALSEIASISERRTERMVNPALSGLPPFLTENGGLNSGLMIAQYASAAMASENKVLAHPASVDSIPTSGNQEDHVSMGSISARKAWMIAENVEYCLSVELLCAAQALDFHRPKKSSPALEAVHSLVRKRVPYLGVDRILHNDLMTIHELLCAGEILAAAEKKIKRVD